MPSGVDYDLWTGPAPLKPFTRNRYHYNWHWIWDTGNGDLGNQGGSPDRCGAVGLGVRLPNFVSAAGGHFMFDDDQETPNTLNCVFGFDQAGGRRKMMEIEVRHWISNNEVGSAVGCSAHHNTIGDIFYGSKGYLAAGNEDSFSYESWVGRDQTAGPHGQSGNDHFANFIKCVRVRKAEELSAPIEEGHLSCALVHLANASYRLGQLAATRIPNGTSDRRRRSEPAVGRCRERLSRAVPRPRRRVIRVAGYGPGRSLAH